MAGQGPSRVLRRDRLGPEDAIDLVHASGGISAIAYPGSLELSGRRTGRVRGRARRCRARRPRVRVRRVPARGARTAPRAGGPPRARADRRVGLPRREQAGPVGRHRAGRPARPRRVPGRLGGAPAYGCRAPRRGRSGWRPRQARVASANATSKAPVATRRSPPASPRSAAGTPAVAARASTSSTSTGSTDRRPATPTRRSTRARRRSTRRSRIAGDGHLRQRDREPAVGAVVHAVDSALGDELAHELVQRPARRRGRRRAACRRRGRGPRPPTPIRRARRACRRARRSRAAVGERAGGRTVVELVDQADDTDDRRGVDVARRGDSL